MEQINRLSNKTVFWFVFILLFPLCLKGQNKDNSLFKPTIKVFDGYLTKVNFRRKKHERFAADYYYRFFVFSKDSLTKVKFKFKQGEIIGHTETIPVSDSVFISKYTSVNTSQFSLKDTSLIIIFWGSEYPKSLKKYYHSIPSDEWRSRLPDFEEKNRINKCGYTMNTQKIKFEAFDYEEYKTYIGKRWDYSELGYWFIFGDVIYPDIVKSNNQFYIASYFY